MNQKQKKLLLTLRFIPFILTNGMNLFPILIFTQLFLKNKDVTHFVLPLILYYSFKTTVLFLIKIKPIKTSRLLKISILIGVVGSVLGAFYSLSFFFILLSGALLGICSGLLYPSFLTVQFHEKTLNNFVISKRDQLYSFGFALVYLYFLFYLIKFSIVSTFIFLAISLLLLLIILSVYPAYDIKETQEYPNYPKVESLFLFSIGFFSIFIIKVDKRLGVANSLPMFFLFLIIVVGIYLFLLYKIKPERRYSKLLTQLIVLKGMLTNFILVFCPFYQLIENGGNAVYHIYGIYLVGIVFSPMFFNFIGRKVKEETLIIFGILIGLFLLSFGVTFYLGVFIITLFSTRFNQLLNQWVYNAADLPRDYRLLAKYRLNNLGSIIHQIMMMFIIYVVTLLTKSATISEIFTSYSNKKVDKTAFLTLDVTKYILITFFVISLFFLNNKLKEKNYGTNLL